MKLVCSGCNKPSGKEGNFLEYCAGIENRPIFIHRAKPYDSQIKNGYIPQPNSNCLTIALVSLGAKLDDPQIDRSMGHRN